MIDSSKRRRRIYIIVVSSIAGLAAVLLQVIPWITPLLSGRKDSATPITTTTTAPPLTIKPLPVRPVVTAFVTTPEQCPAPPPTR